MARVWPCGREKAVSHGRSIADTGVKRTHHASVCRAGYITSVGGDVISIVIILLS